MYVAGVRLLDVTDAPSVPTIPIEADGKLHFGETVDPAKHARSGIAITLHPAGITTHGVIDGMTGSGRRAMARQDQADLDRRDSTREVRRHHLRIGRVLVADRGE